MEESAADKTQDADKGKGGKDDDATKELRAQQEQQEVVRQLQRTLMHLETGREGVYDPLPLVKACSALRLDYPVRTFDSARAYVRVCLCYLKFYISFASLCQQLRTTSAHARAQVFSQNDASQFLTRLWECLEENLPRECRPLCSTDGSESLDATASSAEPKSPFERMQSFFGGSLSSKNKRECGHVTGTRQKFYVLDVEIPGSSPSGSVASGSNPKGVSLQDCLAHLVAGEQMRGDQQMQCYHCTAAKVRAKLFIEGRCTPDYCCLIKSHE